MEDKVLITENEERDVVLVSGTPENVRKVIFAIADAVWPGWCEDEKGREIYMGFADACKDGHIKCAIEGFYNKAKCRVIAHLAVDGVEVEFT